MSYSRGALEAVEAGARMVWRHRVLTALLLVVCVFAVEFTLLKMPQAQAAYTIANSARFISGNSDYLSKTPGSASNRKTWTFSTWVKRAELGAYQNIFQIGTAGSDSTTFTFRFDSSDRLDIGGGATTWRVTSAVYRDPAAWLHLVLVMDTTQATAADRIKLYVNGSQVTAFGTNANPTQNADLAVNNNALHAIGRHNDPTQYLNGYLSDAHLIDGAALAPTCFGTTDANGYWRPITYSTASPCAAYGTNGFHLDFTNGSSLGTDTSGNGNTWTVNGLTSVDQVIDTPTNSFNTFSPIDKNSTQTQSSGNLITGYSGAGGWQGSTRSTFWISSGKWYWELTATNPTSYGAGVTQAADPLTSNPGNSLYGYAYHADGTMLYNNNTNAGSNSTWTSGTHVVGFALDLDSSPKTLKVYLDNALQSNFFSLSGTLFTPFAGGTNNTFGTFNFGQGGLASLTYDSAAGGYFKYTPPSGFKALSTSNLPEPAVAVPKNYFDAVTYTGSGTATSTWAGFVAFQPDLVWIKDRTSALMHNIFDSVRSVIPYWSSNSSAAEVGGFGTALTAFLSNGFSLGTNALFNTSGNNYISWLWKESPTSGVDVVTYTGTGAAQTIAHSLGVVPDFIIVKDRGAANDGAVYHSSNTAAPATDYLLIDSTAATADDDTYWNDTAPTASVFSVKSNANTNASGATYVAYLFASTTGFSAFGTYTGNGSADGPFVYTGFKPRFVLVKKTSAADGWVMHDSARSVYNLANLTLRGEAADAESTTVAQIDILSNGFKVRNTNGEMNTSSGTYIYAAFADIPFQQSAQPYNLTIASSTRFISGNSDYLSKTYGTTATDRKKGTISFWYKRGALGSGPTGDYLVASSYGTMDGSTKELFFGFNQDDQFDIYWFTSGASPSSELRVVTTQVFRDPSAFGHIVFSWDTTQATAADRWSLYNNGVKITSFASVTNPPQNLPVPFAVSSIASCLGIGAESGSCNTDYFDGYLSDAYYVDGQQLTPTSFAEYDTSGYWRPKTYSGTYGTNGFHLPLMGTSTAAGIGIDTSGNNNTWTVSGIATTDFVKDSPTNTYWTLSTLFPNTLGTVANGNLEHTAGTAVAHKSAAAPALPKSGKWYWEVTANNNNGGSGNNMAIGVADVTINPQLPASGTEIGGRTGADYIYRSSGAYYTNNASSGSPATYTTGDTISVAWDADNGKIFFAKNGTWQSSGDPAAGTNPAFSSIAIATGTWAPADSDAETSYVKYYFGQGASTTMSYDSASGGTFKYTPPSGYKALSTANMATPTITIPKNYFDAITYQGSGVARTVATSLFIATSTGTTTWTVPVGVTSVSYLVVAGGGAGGGGSSGGGGGAGGMRTGTLAVTAGTILTVTVGAGGTGGAAAGTTGAAGSDSVFSSITSVGGGGGGGGGAAIDANMTAVGGSGGGKGVSVNGNNYTGGLGTAGQGNNGGATYASNPYAGGGGGGAGAVGGSGASGVNGVGGAGSASSITGSSVTYAGGGGSGANAYSPTPAAGGSGGGGAGGTNGGTAGTANTGGGGGGGGGDGTQLGAAGGSGIVVISYTPNASTIGFTPDLVWIKDRTSANAHGIFSTSTTLYPAWASNAATAEGGAGGTALNAFLSNGFSLGASSTVNTLGDNFIAWMWKKCPAIIAILCPASNGVDIVKYTGTGANRTISHSLGTVPDMMILKRRDSTGNSTVYHGSLTASTTQILLLNTTAAVATDATAWNSTAPTASVYSLGTNVDVNASAGTYVAYLFKGVDGFSKFGSYTGNAAADGPFIYTGFKPKYIMIKSSTATDAWLIYDTARNTFNVAGTTLVPNTAAADATISGIDFLSNGFKLRTITTTPNAAQTYIYAAFAEQPFKYSAASAASVASTFVQAVAFLMGMVF